MIISASYRTDIPAFYGSWFRGRLEAGHALVASPYGGKPYRVDLRPAAVDGFVFWSRNMAPFLTVLEDLVARGTVFVVQFTVTGYPRPLEASVIAREAAVAQIKALSSRHGRRSVVWRYDPVLLTTLTDRAFHLQQFSQLARALEGQVDEVAISFAHIYAKTRRNLDRAARAHGFGWHDPGSEEKQALREQLQAIAADHGIALTVCSQPESGGQVARCIDAQRLGDVAGRAIDSRQKGNRPGCLCAESRDIGAYDSCPHGCVYCYAVASRSRVLER